MERGLYIAASGMLAEMRRQDLLANDLANASTPGYKADRTSQRSFGELLLRNTQTGEPIGALGQGAEIAAQVTDLRPQALRETGEPLDLAVAGEGWFGVRTPQGVRYTRDGSFRADAQGMLVDQLGNRVVGANGGAVPVKADGTVDPAAVGLFNVPGARKAGNAYFTGQATGRPTGSIRTGALEGSGVDPSRAMVDMIASMRSFESGQKVIATIDDTLDRAAGQVGGLPG